MMEGVRDTAGKVGGEARRLRTEAVRVQRVRGRLGLGDEGNHTGVAEEWVGCDGVGSAKVP